MKKNLLPFITFWLLNSLLLFLSVRFYPAYFVLGNKSMSAIWAAFASGLVWTFLTWMASPLLGNVLKLKGKILIFGFYFLVNFFALWITARLAPVFGFGTTRFIWLVFLAIIADIFQYIIWKLGKFGKMLS